MSERVTSSNEYLPREQVAALYEQAGRLYQLGMLPFGGLGEGSEDSSYRNRVRYRNGDELITILNPAATLPYDLTEGPAHTQLSLWLNLSLETPLPPTERWPNAYVRHDFMLPKDGRAPVEDEADSYLHTLEITRYSAEGVFDEGIEAAIAADFWGISGNSGTGSAEIQEVFARQETFRLNTLREVRHLYPDYAPLLEEEWAPDYCGERIAMLAELTMSHEVGCDPSPYGRR